MRFHTLLLSGAIAALPAAALRAQDVTHPANVFVGGELRVEGITRLDDKVCIGNTCGTTESIGTDDLIKLKFTKTSIYFNDTSGGVDPSGDWRLLINDNFWTTSGGIDRFSVEHVNAGTIPFTIAGNAPENALWISPSGHIGMGTSLPQGKLHLADDTLPSIILDRTSGGGGTPYTWALGGDAAGFGIGDQITGNNVFSIAAAAPENAFTVASNGAIGLGTDMPGAGLHLTRSDGAGGIKVEETNGTTTPRTLMNLVNNGRPEIVMANTDAGGEWSFGAGTNFVLKQGGVGTLSSAKTKYLTLFAGSGNLEISGQIITGGPTCGAGCDAVFSADYALPSIEQHAEAMFALGHLPNVGPTAPGAPFNLSEKLGDMLNELEHAHIYIARQEQRLSAQDATIAAQQDVIAEMRRAQAALESRLADLETRTR